MFIIFGGLPGVGKTTIAKALAKQLKAVYLRIDTVEQMLKRETQLDGPVQKSLFLIHQKHLE